MKHLIQKLYGATQEEFDSIYQTTPEGISSAQLMLRGLTGHKGGKAKRHKKQSRLVIPL